MLERLKSFRKKKKTYFPYLKFSDNVKIKILQNLSPAEISIFASCSSDSNLFVQENRDKLPKNEFQFVEINYGPATDAVCIRCFNPNQNLQSVVLDSRTIIPKLKCLSIKHSLSFVFGTFTAKEIEGEIFSEFNPLTFPQMATLQLSISALKRVIDFIYQIDEIVTIFLSRSWTNCEKFKVDNHVFVFNEKLYKEKAKIDHQSLIKRFSNRFAKMPNEKMAYLCLRGRNELSIKHHCDKCSDDNLTIIDFYKNVEQ